MLKRLHLNCAKIIPTVYDDTMSFNEAICKLTHAVNELIANYTNVIGALENMSATVEDCGEEEPSVTVTGGASAEEPFTFVFKLPIGGEEEGEENGTT